MQKIMFEHRRFGLEQAVIARLKENTRRRVRFPKGVNDKDVESAVMGIDQKGRVYFTFSVATHQGTEAVDVYPKYQIGERVAVAQSYKTIYDTMEEQLGNSKANEWWCSLYSKLGDNVEPIMEKGYDDKFFVRADAMPHVIEITDIKAERLQDISDEDCLREGVYKDEENGRIIGYPIGVPFFYTFTGAVSKKTRKQLYWTTPKEAFSELIDRVCGRGTWDSNPWVVAYQFHLQRAKGLPK